MDKESYQQANEEFKVKKSFLGTHFLIALGIFFTGLIALFLFLFSQQDEVVNFSENLVIYPINKSQKEEILRRNANVQTITDEQKQAILKKNNQ